MIIPDRVREIAELLAVDYSTAEQVLKDDERIDKGEKLFELTPEQKKNAKLVARKPTVYQFTKRERKEDTAKRDLIALLGSVLQTTADTPPEITNPERQIDFTVGGRKFRIVLSAPRS